HMGITAPMFRLPCNRPASHALIRALAWATACISAASLPACAIKSDAARDRADGFASAVQLSPADWPARAPERVDALIEPTPKVVKLVVNRTDAPLGPNASVVMEVHFGTVTHCARYGLGLIR